MRNVDALAIFHAELRRLEVAASNGHDPRLPVPVDWHALLRREINTEWLVENLWPSGRQCHMHAARKTGKSLVSLWMACELACGRDPFTGKPQPPIRVGYLDYEMTEDDLAERIEEMGYNEGNIDPLDNLKYFLHPNIPKLDTKAGGEMLLETLQAHGIKALVVDTMSRVVAGDENSNDTYIRFYDHTGQMLKAAGIALFRLDHEGHETGRSRGASSKADDVDIVWQLRITDDGLQFVRKASRLAWVPEHINVLKDSDPLRFRTTIGAWPAGTSEKADELDKANVPTDASRRTASSMLKAAGIAPGKTLVLAAAIKFRQMRPIATEKGI